MPQGARSLCLVFIVLGFLAVEASHAQLDSIRTLDDIGRADARRINEWVTQKVAELQKSNDDERIVRFLDAFVAERLNRANTAAFVDAFAEQTAEVAVQWFAQAGSDWQIGMALARVLVDMDRAQAVPAFLAGLASKAQAVRYLSAVGLVGQQNALVADSDLRTRVIDAVKTVGIAETNGTIIQHLYRVIAFDTLAPEVFDAYMAIFDARLTRRRGGAVISDGGEIEAYEFFRKSSVLNALKQTQKEELVRRLAVFLRFDAERYVAPNLNFQEKDYIERSMDGIEAILAAVTGAGGGQIRQRLGEGAAPEALLQEARRWYGHEASDTLGKLNDDPWKVTKGAP
ncbi:MAG: hypothetical protein JSV78_06570 [Phycisphaerales bacterium]|nr:MAG: hypothetical protein JSV78_06570 [Phycisphaerales bacterium]